jgi:hypothetical protein
LSWTWFSLQGQGTRVTTKQTKRHEKMQIATTDR